MPEGSTQQTSDFVGWMRLANRPSAPREARGQLRHCLADAQVSAAATDVLMLLASEVVTNALRHGAPPREMRVYQSGEVIRVEITDSSPVPPRRRTPDADAPGGRGLWLLDSLALRWGFHQDATGKCVWFETAR
jgi:anti-sigma regulatory factor (Ser/Thr protein kinase)